MDTPWETRILNLIETFEHELAVVLNAGGCREGWLQGELFRRLRTDGVINVQTNQYPYTTNNRARADLWLSGQMVAEIKVLGDGGYPPKVIDGWNSIKRVRESYHPHKAAGRRAVAKELVDDALGNSLIWDFKRLSGVEDTYVRILLLIIQTSGQPDDVGRALHALRLPGKESSRVFDDFIARIWTLD